ncbi:bifunctional 4-hydroxy-2-oxoglutarate aldolase/2-dehydro-3-deoxy-phosphogluconate aldolase [soil metagenome]
MAAHGKLATLEQLRRAGLVAVLHHVAPDTAWQMVDALCRGGFGAIEFTNRGDHAIEGFTMIERNARLHHPGCVVGVGSVVDAGTATTFMNAGADFVVGPALVEEVAVTCNRRQVPYIPGCGTLSEMLRANELGCEVVKAFPAASLGGPDFLRAVKAPCPWLEVMPTGGVEATSQNLRAWFDAGVFAVGLGSKLVPKDAVAGGDWGELTRLAEQAVATLTAVR